MKKKILVIGSLNTDLVINVRAMPLIGETILGNKLSYVQGGKGANQAYAAAKTGGCVTMLGCVGADDFGKAQIQNLSGENVDVSRLKESREHPTGTAVIYVDENGDNSIVVVSGANNDCTAQYLKEHDEVLQSCDYLILQMEIPFEAIRYAIERASRLGKTVILNPAPISGPLPDDILPMIDYITPNETELMKLCGIDSCAPELIREGAQRLLSKGVKNVLLTLGEQGAMHVSSDGYRLYPARKVKAVDTTAAGDCFNAAFVVALSEGKSEEEAIAFANIASSIAVTRVGAQTSIPSRLEIDEESTTMNESEERK